MCGVGWVWVAWRGVVRGCSSVFCSVKQKKAYVLSACLVGLRMCMKDRVALEAVSGTQRAAKAGAAHAGPAVKVTGIALGSAEVFIEAEDLPLIHI